VVANTALVLQLVLIVMVPLLGGAASLAVSVMLTSLFILVADQLSQPENGNAKQNAIRIWKETLMKQVILVAVFWLLFDLMWLLGVLAFIGSLGGVAELLRLVERFTDVVSYHGDVLILFQEIAPHLLVLLVVPALLLLPLMMMYWFSPALIVLGKMGVLDAMKTSFSLCYKNMGALTWLSVVMLVALVVACLPLFVGLLVLNPIMTLLFYTSYKAISLPMPLALERDMFDESV
jgi:uncharacterized membrane protein